MNTLTRFCSQYPILARAIGILIAVGLAVAIDGLENVLAQAMHMYPWSGLFLVAPAVLPGA